ncbi:RNA binding domain protein [Aspergillus japonicus CBS 114.51]|uniref:RNA binding domain protein n=1 Tax=Aspergillus japonicus CBS 114.51 TaxID=1448312 RepID=A0A8T8X7H5_ASPJA|nr:RNA binding domain protein [Aspergillus japonicus CBS 114.51]RAH83399.1 RNA binding domain protein [Aspergillus japonicus CBS 114.51]
MSTKIIPARGGAQSKPPLSGLPNQTLYCTNLPDKLRKRDLRLSLYMLFSTYGTVLDVVAMKTEKMRGQAHIVFKDVQASTQAMRALQGFEFFGKQMKIMYAKGTSDVIARLRGTYSLSATTSGGQAVAASTELQKSIFSGPPGSATLPPKHTGEVNGEAPTAHGVKRPREEESDEEDAPMDEDSDVSMEASSDED